MLHFPPYSLNPIASEALTKSGLFGRGQRWSISPPTVSTTPLNRNFNSWTVLPPDHEFHSITDNNKDIVNQASIPKSNPR